MAVAMTKARLGSQSPRRSRKPITFAGLIICETVSPKPKSRPEASAANTEGMGSDSDRMTEQEARDHGSGHENRGCDKRAWREPSQPADTMSASAAAAEARAEAD